MAPVRESGQIVMITYWLKLLAMKDAVADCAEDIWRWTAWGRYLIALPFRAIAWFAWFCVATTRWLIQAFVLTIAGLFGFIFLARMTYGFVRIVFHPLFE